MDLLGLSRDLIAAHTVSENGTMEAIRVLQPLYVAAGLRVLVLEIPGTGGRQQNLLATYSGDDDRGLLLVTHLDTVDPGPTELWTETGGNPFALFQKGDALYGLGTADTKLDALCKLVAAKEYRGRKLRRSLQLLGTCEEEVGAKGARHFVKGAEFTARFVACSEPSELTLIRAHKGYVVVETELQLRDSKPLRGPLERLVFDGRSAHSSTPHLGVNAIVKALDALAGSSFASLEGGTVSNKVPARCTVLRPVQGNRTSSQSAATEAADGSAAAKLSLQLFSLWQEVASSLQPQMNPEFDPSHSVVNWGVARIEGPKSQLTFDARLLPGHDPDTLVSTFAHRAETLAQGQGAQIALRVNRASPAMELREPSELLAQARAACRDVGLDDTPRAKPTNTEAGVFAAGGAESIVFGPGRSTGNAHCANEHNLYSQLQKAIEFYKALIARLCT